MWNFSSYDLRQTGGRHWSDETVFGQRAQFDLKLTPPSLRVRPVRPGDQDTYRCRVDYEHGPSKTSTVHLAVIGEAQQIYMRVRAGVCVGLGAGFDIIIFLSNINKCL